jgi:hypothetical protein
MDELVTALIAAVGLYRSNPVDPQLETAWFQPLSLPLDPSWKTGYKLCSFKCKLCRYAAGHRASRTHFDPAGVRTDAGPVGAPARVDSPRPTAARS